jgi:diaminopimelate epimerase
MNPGRTGNPRAEVILAFTKMHGLGNDFVILDGSNSAISLSPQQCLKLADRRLGIGCDQILIIESDHNSGFAYRVINADGSEVEQCGNGARCVARYLFDQQRVSETFQMSSASGAVEVRILPGNQVQIAMGSPAFEPEQIPLRAKQRQPLYILQLEQQSVTLSAISMGNPHAVIQVDDIEHAPVLALGPAVQQSDWFPQGVNVGFMQVVDSARINLRVFERGVGETLACGSGACAAVVAGRSSVGLAESVSVSLPGGDLQISWPGEGHQVLMTGPAQYAFRGTIDL